MARSRASARIKDVRIKDVRIKDVAARAGVSVGTVSNVLNRPEVVTEATRRKVLAVIDEVGFVRNGSASRLRTARNTAIGLVVIDVGNPFFTDVVRGVEAAAEGPGYVVMLCNSDSSPDREARHVRFLEEQRVAGVVITPTIAKKVLPRLDELRARGVAVVLLDEPAPTDDVCSVTVDDVRGGEIAGKHLLDIGRRRIVYVKTQPRFRQFEDRLTGLRRAIAAHRQGADIRLDVVRIATLDPRAVFDATAEVLAGAPDAVFCANDIAALALLRGFHAKGVDVPSDIALIGYDDIAFASMASVPLTSVRQPAYELGRTAAQLLLEECATEDQDHRHRHIVFQPELVVRQSTDPHGADRPSAERHGAA